MNNPKKTNEFLYFALKNKKVLLGLSIILLFLVLGFIGPLINHNKPLDYVDPTGAHPPSAKYWFGTTFFGQDVFSQFVHGLQATFLVGLLGGGIGTLMGMLIGFVAGYRGGIVDEILNAFTNIVLVIPTFAVLLIIAAYLQVRSVVHGESLYWIYGLALGGKSHPCSDFLLAYQRFCRSFQDDRNEVVKDHHHGYCAKHAILSGPDLHPPVWRSNPRCCYTGFHWSWPNKHDFAWANDAVFGPLGRSSTWFVVVVYSTGPCDHDHRRRPIRHECWTG